MYAMERQGRATQFVAWAWVVAVHAALAWLLLQGGRGSPMTTEVQRLRLSFITLPELPPPVSPRHSDDEHGKTTVRPPAAWRPAVAVELPESSSLQTEEPLMVAGPDLRAQTRPWSDRQDPPGFPADPLRSRTARLPGGERGDTYRMREPPSLARGLAAVAGLFGDPGPPCPRIQARIAGLLPGTSPRERELLEEELRRDRQQCRN